MVKRCIVILVMLALLIQFVPGGILQTASVEAREPAPPSKISSLLALQVKAKLKATQTSKAPATQEAMHQMHQIDVLQAQGLDTENLDNQQIYIHFTREPTQSQLEELKAEGIIPYPESWIPPVGSHPTGFILADMPVERLSALAEKGFVTRLETAEIEYEPLNDLGTQKINADDVWTSGYNGTGVRIAVLDSGFDLSHADFQNPVDMKDYSNYPTSLDDTIANTVTGHGTHVAGSVLGRGTQSSGVYKGSAPDAHLIFLKIGKDSTGGASSAAMSQAIRDAVDVYDADIITMSYGGWGQYHDGTSEQSQAVDYAFSKGAVVFISAGNSGSDDEHYSGTVAAGSTTGFIQIIVTAGSSDTPLLFNMVWFDGTGTSNALSMQFYDNTQATLDTYNDTQSQSSRGTEARMGWWGTSGEQYALPVGSYSTYVKITNSSGSPQDFHLYVYTSGGGSVTFNSPDQNYTLCSPADADSAIAVGAYTSRTGWYAYDNAGPYYLGSGQILDQISSFSSRGPRVDTGATGKPNIVAPGAYIISTRDNDVYPWPSGASAYFVDNDGPNENNSSKNNGSGPADYYVMQGTSMACPIAAGVAALILEKNPDLTPTQVKNAIESNATDKGSAGWDSTYGWGLIDALASMPETPPSVSTANATNITNTSATLNGNLTSLGDYGSANASFEWGTTSGNLTQQTTPQVKGSTGSFSANLSSLSPGTTYYFRAKAAANPTVYGSESSFNTTSLLSVSFVEINSGNEIFLFEGETITKNWLTETGIPVEVKNLPDLGAPANGLASYTFDLSWDKNVIRVDSAAASVSAVSGGWSTTIPPGPYTNGAVTISGYTITYSTDDILLLVLGITAVGNAGDSTSINVTITSLYDKDNIAIPAVSVNASVSISNLVSIGITPAEPSVALGRTRQLTATGTYTDNSTADITANVTWDSSNTGVATVSSSGLATSLSIGTTVITATLSGKSSNTTLAVTAAELDTISVTPTNPSITVGQTQQFTANGTFSDNSALDFTDNVTWTSGNTSVATIDVAGMTTALAAGNATIIATSGNVSGNTTLSVIASVEINSGTAIILGEGETITKNWLTETGIPVDVKNLPDLGPPANGLASYTFDLSWDKNVIRVDSAAASVSAVGGGWSTTIPPGPYTNGTVTISGYTTTYSTDDILMLVMGITAVGNAGDSTSINVTITSLYDKDNTTIPAIPVNANVEIIDLIAETSLNQTLSSNTTDVVVVNVNIDRTKDPVDDSTANITGGIGSYSATASGIPGNSIQFLTVFGVSPFDGPTFNATTGVFGVTSVGSPIQASNTTIAEVVAILTGNTTTSVNLTISFQDIIAAGNPSLNIPEEHSNSLIFLRGDTDGNGDVDIGDASWIAQYVVGMRTLSQLNALNAASVSHDGASGDIIDIGDSSWIAQYVVGMRNGYFE